jgi:hypothetical protein
MAELSGVKIQRGKIGANTITDGDGIAAIVIGSPVTGQLAHKVAKVIYNLSDAESLGINQAFDVDNDVNVYRHIKEFYRMATEGNELHIMLVDPAVTMVAILEDTDLEYAKRLLIEAKGKVRQLAVAVNPTGITTFLNGLPDDVFNAIPKAQGLYDWADALFMPCQVLLEGYDYVGTAATVISLREIPNVSAPKVSLVNGQDWGYADTLTGNAKKFADVGTALGTLAACAINQNIGENESFNLTDATKNSWLVPGLSSHQKNTDVIEDLQTLEDKGFIFGIEYIGMAGVRWNNDHTCVAIVVDSEGNVNEHTISYGRTHDKARRLLRTALLPKVKTTHAVDSETGKISLGVLKNFENIGNEVLGDMIARLEISDGETTVDPNSDIIVDKELKLSFVFIPYGTIATIKGTSNLKTLL